MMLVTFYSVSAALYLETLLKKAHIPCRVIPVPRALSSSCGYAAEVEGETPDALVQLFKDNAIEWESLYTVHEEDTPPYHQVAQSAG
ncbi:MAG: DUF3343 domain-containing protein [Oscillospiraceae bacterium]